MLELITELLKLWNNWLETERRIEMRIDELEDSTMATIAELKQKIADFQAEVAARETAQDTTMGTAKQAADAAVAAANQATADVATLTTTVQDLINTVEELVHPTPPAPPPVP